jgi:hypothetical protein
MVVDSIIVAHLSFGKPKIPVLMAGNAMLFNQLTLYLYQQTHSHAVCVFVKKRALSLSQV